MQIGDVVQYARYFSRAGDRRGRIIARHVALVFRHIVILYEVAWVSGHGDLGPWIHEGDEAVSGYMATDLEVLPV